MAVVATSLENTTNEVFADQKNRFSINATSTDAQGTEIIKAAPGTGISIYLTKITISCATAITVTVGEDEAASAVVTPIVGPVPFGTGGGQQVFDFGHPIKMTANKLLAFDASGAGAIQILAEGYTA